MAFISYSRKDSELINECCDIIESLGLGIDIWKDTNDLVAGQKPLSEIAEAIRKSTFFIVFLTKSSIKSNYVKKELNLALNKYINTGYPIVIPVLVDVTIQDIPFEISDTQYISLKSIDFNYFSQQIYKTIELYQYLKIGEILRIGEGVIDCDNYCLKQIICIDTENLEENKFYEIPFSSLGTPSMIKVINPKLEEELDCVIKKDISNGLIGIKLEKGIDISKIEVEIDTYLNNEKLNQLVKIENFETKKEFFGYQSDVIIRNMTGFHIHNFPVKIKLKKLKLGIQELKLKEEMKRMKQPYREIEAPKRLQQLIEKHQNIDLKRFSMFQFMGKSVFNIKRHDKAFPKPKKSKIFFPSPIQQGEFTFILDMIKPEATLSYEIVGMDLAERYEEMRREEERKKTKKINRAKQ